MKRLSASSVQYRWWLLVAFASIAGGLAEIAWVSFYGALTSTNIVEVARQVTVSFSHELGETPMAVPLGILIHLALVMGCAYVLLIWQPFARRAGMAVTLLSAALALAAVWALNFFVVLPALNQTFVALMPYAVTFASKMMFALALALAGVLIAGNSRSRKQASSYDRTSERSEQGFLFGLRPSPRSHRRNWQWGRGGL